MDKRFFWTALPLCHFAALLSAASSKSPGIVGAKLFPSPCTSIATSQSQPSDCKQAAHHRAHKSSLQRYNARQADLSSVMSLRRWLRN